MPEVFIDGESIQFDGPAPGSLEALLGLLEQALGESGRVLAGVSIDGVQVESGVAAGAYEMARRVDVVSLTVADAVARVAAGCARSAAQVRQEAENLATEVVRRGWSDVESGVLVLSERLGQLLQELGSLESHESLGPVVHAWAEALNRWMDGVGARDAAVLCLCLLQEIIPLLTQVRGWGAALTEGHSE